MEGTYIIGVEKDGQSVTIEPGGQFELSGAPLSSVHDTRAETQAHLDQVWSVLMSVAMLSCNASASHYALAAGQRVRAELLGMQMQKH